ncbi:hypothetical protein XENORESO_012761 [Xenotaenia resolanae]|uniref:Uncharacterized protein n=1 Tax=Xenotaenia resolanae TaxID=208358 RepID=A0ABV0W8D8_9TELE
MCTQEGLQCSPGLLFQATGGKPASIRAASGNLRRKAKPRLFYYTLYMNECWIHEEQNHYLSWLHVIAVIVVTFGSQLKSHVCLPARRHSGVVPLLSCSCLRPKWNEASSDSSSSSAEVEVSVTLKCVKSNNWQVYISESSMAGSQHLSRKHSQFI